MPVAVDTWRGFVFVNPDVNAPSLLESNPELDGLADRTKLDFSTLTYRQRWTYEIPANWKIWVENATECYHCPTVHRESFSDAFDTDEDVYELIEVGNLLCQFTRYQPKVGAHRDGRFAGMTTYMNVDAANHRLEIGSTWYRRSVQRSALNTECKRMLLAHAFETLDCIAVEFRTHWFNFQSRAAIARLGAKQDGVLRSHQRLPDGSLRDTVVFSIIASEWPAVKAHLDFQLARPRES